MGYRVQQPVPWLRSARIDSGGRKRFRQKPLGRQLGIPTTATLPPENQVFGVFAYGGGEGIRGALLDTNTGEFLRAGASTKLPAICTQQALAGAVAKLLEDADWSGHIGVGLPGRIQDGVIESWLQGGRADRAQLERMIEQATGCRVAVMRGAEAVGYGEMAYGAATSVHDLVMMVCVGRAGLGVALFRNGCLIPNVNADSIVGRWSTSWAPPKPDDLSATAWNRWAERLDSVLLQLEDRFSPAMIVLGGSVVREGISKVLPLLTVQSRVPRGVVAESLGMVGGVKGAAFGAQREFRTRDALSQVRIAVGGHERVAPADLSADQLKAVFEQFADPFGTVGAGRLRDMLGALGLGAPDDEELRRISETLGDGGAAAAGSGAPEVVAAAAAAPEVPGPITWPTWHDWWRENVTHEPVATLMSEEAFEKAIMSEPADKVLCLEVGSTFCRPCRAFDPAYKRVAKGFTPVRFLRIDGNENRSLAHLSRDVLGVRATPSFYLFYGGSPAPISFHMGTNEQKLRDALDKALAGAEENLKASKAARASSGPAAKAAKAVSSAVSAAATAAAGVASAAAGKLAAGAGAAAETLEARVSRAVTLRQERAASGARSEAPAEAAAAHEHRGAAAEQTLEDRVAAAMALGQAREAASSASKSGTAPKPHRERDAEPWAGLRGARGVLGSDSTAGNGYREGLSAGEAADLDRVGSGAPAAAPSLVSAHQSQSRELQSAGPAAPIRTEEDDLEAQLAEAEAAATRLRSQLAEADARVRELKGRATRAAQQHHTDEGSRRAMSGGGGGGGEDLASRYRP